MTLKEEVVFYIEAKMKAEKAGTDKGFEQRLKLLFLEGSISDKAYPILMEIFEYKRPELKPIFNYREPVLKETNVQTGQRIVQSDPCTLGSSTRFSPRC